MGTDARTLSEHDAYKRFVEERAMVHIFAFKTFHAKACQHEFDYDEKNDMPLKLADYVVVWAQA